MGADRAVTQGGCVPATYLRFAPLGLGELGGLDLLVVVVGQQRCQHVQLLHPQRSAPLLGLLGCDLEVVSPEREVKSPATDSASPHRLC